MREKKDDDMLFGWIIYMKILMIGIEWMNKVKSKISNREMDGYEKIKLMNNRSNNNHLWVSNTNLVNKKIIIRWWVVIIINKKISN